MSAILLNSNAPSIFVQARRACGVYPKCPYASKKKKKQVKELCLEMLGIVPENEVDDMMEEMSDCTETEDERSSKEWSEVQISD